MVFVLVLLLLLVVVVMMKIVMIVGTVSNSVATVVILVGCHVVFGLWNDWFVDCTVSCPGVGDFVVVS